MNQPSQPQQPAAPNEGATHPGTPNTDPKGIPDGMEGDAKGTPDSGRHETEIAPKK